ncbi:hypothetical protein DFJ73DRAFT_767680 [Zopfochytrium polystomum]|nr:hypothetical protein DFJ73DRAFT_767680 [Zopfochytrium polystomum]
MARSAVPRVVTACDRRRARFQTGTRPGFRSPPKATCFLSFLLFLVHKGEDKAEQNHARIFVAASFVDKQIRRGRGEDKANTRYERTTPPRPQQAQPRMTAISPPADNDSSQVLRRLSTIPRGLTIDQLLALPADIATIHDGQGDAHHAAPDRSAAPRPVAGRRRPPGGAPPATQPKKFDFDAMISYAWADKDLVRPLVTKLERMNVRVWIDVNNMGRDINEAMIDGIRRAAVVVAFLSDSYIASHNCKLEIKFANDIHKPIIPVRLASTEKVTFSAAAFVTAGQLYIDLTKGVGANSHEAIAASIFKLSTTSLEAITISSTDHCWGGSFGMVRKGLYLESIPVAVKTLKLSKLSEKSKLELIKEANILQKSRHPFIIGFHGVININEYLSLVLEFASLGSLHDYYLNPDNEDTPLKQRLTFLIQVSAGMSYLHDTLKIMHNDLKSLNVLLTKTYQDGSIVSKITDFGLSKIKTETMTRSTSSAAAGSILWLAPELKSVRPKVSTANDVYSFAVLMTEVLSWTGAYGIPWEDTEINLQGFIDALRFPNDRENLLQELQSVVFQAETAAALLAWKFQTDLVFSAIWLELKALTELVETQPDVAKTAEGAPKAAFLPQDVVDARHLHQIKLERNATDTAASVSFGSAATMDFAELAETLTAETHLAPQKKANGANVSQVLSAAQTLVNELEGQILAAKKLQCSDDDGSKSVDQVETPGDGYADLLIDVKNHQIDTKTADTLIGLHHTTTAPDVVSKTAPALPVTTRPTPRNDGAAPKPALPQSKSSTRVDMKPEDVSALKQYIRGKKLLGALGPTFLSKEKILKLFYGVTHLEISSLYNKFTYVGAQVIAEALRADSTLQSINLSHNHIGQEGAKALADALIVNNSLQSIVLSGNHIGQEGAKALADALRVNSSLQSIDLHWNHIGQEGAKALADSLRVNNSLQSIDLWWNHIGQEGAKALADALKVNTTLQSMNLTANGIGQVGAKALADALRTNTSLKSIDLRNNRIGQNGEKALANVLKGKTTLKVEW